MRTMILPIVLGVAVGLSACKLKDGDRCDEGQIFDGTSCLEPDTDSDITADAGADAGFTGMMEPCTSGEDCAEYEATYCLTMMPDSNICLIQDCNPAPNDCPSPYLCCDLTAAVEELGLPGSLCMPPEYWETYSMYCANQ